MRALHLIAPMIAAALVSACAATAKGPPEIQVDRSACAHCTMLISEPRYAAAYQLDGAEARLFDDIACLLDALSHEAKAPAHAWFMDANDAAWIEAAKAAFVASDAVRTPMGGGITAYRDVTSAEAAASRHNGSVIRTFDELRQAKGKD